MTLFHISKKSKSLDPKNILQRGYSVTRFNGVSVTDASSLTSGMIIETELASGKTLSRVE